MSAWRSRQILGLWLFAVCLWLASSRAGAFIRSRGSDGSFLTRSDSGNVTFLINERTAPGLTNSSGGVTITADSDPLNALQAAMTTWSQAPSASVTLATPGRTAKDSSQPDGQHIVTFVDTDSNRSIVGDFIAVTRVYSLAGEIVDTDLIFNPTLSYSTTLQSGTFDIQSVATHELGHALGASHSGLLAATMFAFSRRANDSQSRLTADDVAFLTEAYPAPGAAGPFGSISGNVTLSGGGPVFGALVTAIDPSTGIAVGNITLRNGSYTIPRIPPGRYFVYAEPLDGPVTPADLSAAAQGANVDFSTALLGGAASPQAVLVSAGENAAADLTAEGGAPALNIDGAGVGPIGAALSLFRGPGLLGSGQTVDFAVFGKGLDDRSISEGAISFLGAPITIQPGSLGRSSVTLTSTGATVPALRFTVKVAATAPLGVATLLIRSATAAVVYSAGARIMGPAPAFPAAGVVSGASFAGGPASPGEIVSIFGTGLGPASGVGGYFDPVTGRLSSRVADVMVTFNGVRAPLFYVSQGQINAQVPIEVADQPSASVVVTSQGVSSAPVAIPLASVRPGIFVWPGRSQGILLNQDNTINDAGNAASRGSVVTAFATGLGAVRPALPTGQPAALSPLSEAAQKVSATIGGRPGRVLFAGMAPNFVGLFQVNVEVPADAPVGATVPLALDVGDRSTQPNVTLAVR